MNKIFAKLLLAVLLFQAQVSFGQLVRCTPLPPPSTITFSNVSPNSVTATWGPTITTSWHQVVLTNVSTNTIVDVSITQSYTKTYVNLQSGTSYRVDVSSSTCQQGPFGESKSEPFETPSIIIDDVVLIVPNSIPNQQEHLAPADLPLSWASGESRFVCLPKEDPDGSDDPQSDVFHAYFYPDEGSSDFIEFTLMGDINNKAHFPLSYNTEAGGNGSEHWSISYFNQNGQTNSSDSKIIRTMIYHNPSPKSGGNWTLKMVLSLDGTMINGDFVPIKITKFDNIQFYYAENNCTVGLTNACGVGVRPAGRVERSNQLEAELAIKPNPFSDYLDISMEAANDAANESTTTRTIRIFNASGQTLYSSTTNPMESNTLHLNTENWNPGVYYLQIIDGSDSRIHALVRL